MRRAVVDLRARYFSLRNVQSHPLQSSLRALTGSVEEIAAAMRGYAELGVQHIMFQCEPYSPEALRRLTEALQLYRGNGQQ